MADIVRDYLSVSKGSAMLYQATTPQVIRAVVTLVFLAIIGGLLLQGKEIPQVIETIFLFIMGSYFETSPGVTQRDGTHSTGE